MDKPGGARSGVLVVRLWMEGPAGEGGLRARVSASAGHGSADLPVATAASADAVATAVRSWLEGLLASGRVDFWELMER
jgi:hypothetical protein